MYFRYLVKQLTTIHSEQKGQAQKYEKFVLVNLWECIIQVVQDKKFVQKLISESQEGCDFCKYSNLTVSA